MYHRLIALIIMLLFAVFLLPAHSQQATKRQPTELMLWARADDLLTFFKDGERINQWPDAGGKKLHLSASGEERPYLIARGFGEHATVAFQGDRRAVPAINHAMQLPLGGEWRGITLFLAGVNVHEQNVFDSAPGMRGSLRHIGALQHTGNTVVIANPFPSLRGKRVPAVITITLGIDAAGIARMASYANGVKEAEVFEHTPLYGVIVNGARLGDIARGANRSFNGEISEVIIYYGVLSEEERARTEHYLMTKYALTEPGVDDPQFPFGYTPPQDKETEPLPKVEATPFTVDLTLWMRADDLFGAGFKDGMPIDAVPNTAGNKRPITSEALFRPRYLPAGMNGRPVLRFEGDNRADPKVTHLLRLPLAGEQQETTIFVVGRNLDRAGVFETAPGVGGSLRARGNLEITRSPLMEPRPFPLLAQGGGAQMICVIAGKTAEHGQFIETYANGQFQRRREVAESFTPVLFRNPTLGTNNMGTHFNGQIAEVLIYTRALNAAERRLTEEYLHEKWGVPLDVPEGAKPRSRWSTRITQLPRVMSWFGNTFSGKTEWVQNNIRGIAVFPDGVVAATSVWDEPHKEIGFYKDGLPVGPNIQGGSSKISYNGQYLYAGLSGMRGNAWAGIWRLTHDGKEAPWAEMGEKKWPTFPTPGEWHEIQGIAVSATEIFVTAQGVNVIHVFDLATATLKRSLPIPAPGSLIIDNDGLLWLGNRLGAAQYSLDGTATGKMITGIRVGALAIDAQGLLAAAENGERQQVIFYDITGEQPQEVKALLQHGGAWAQPEPGRVTVDRLIDPNGLGFDANGNIYVSGNGVLRSYTPDGTLRWQIYSTVFVTCSDFDPATDGNDIYSGLHHYRYQPGQPPGNDWPLTGVTFDHRRFPEMAGQMAQNSILRRIDGRLYRFAIGTGVYVSMKEQEGSIFAPVAIYAGRGDKDGQFRPKAAPQDGRFTWSDLDNNGIIDNNECAVPLPGAQEFAMHFYSYGIDERGGICEPLGRYGVRYTAVKEFSVAGVPVYDIHHQILYPRPPEFSEILRSYYYAETDTMYLAGYTWDFPARGSEHWGNCGREVVVYNNWSKPQQRTIRSRIPYPDGLLNAKSISVLDKAGLLFVGEMETSVVFVYDTDNGNLLGIVEPDLNLVGAVGWIDISEGIRAFERENGEILLLVEDSWTQKEMVYRIPRLKKER